jgi:formylglycine-generating enzyme required for sulfatase activity
MVTSNRRVEKTRSAAALLMGLYLLSSSAVFGDVFEPDVGGTGLTMDGYMIAVPGGGEAGGPRYTYRMGKYELTNRQLCAFLNDAEADASSAWPTRRSSGMYFHSSGCVYMDPNASPYEYLLWEDPASPDFDLTYNAALPPGERYGIRPGREKLAARHISWCGALKFCNWLTIDQGLGEENICYTEGPHIGDWHPITITTADWWGKTPVHNDRVSAGRDLNDAEREALVRRYRGYRLPMDDAGPLAGIDRPYPNDFNEWLKAAAYDPNAPATTRTNAGGWTATPYHWMYGFGRENNTGADANWYGSGDPFDQGPTPVDYFDGTDHGGTFATNDTANHYGFYGMAGNVWEYCQDYGVSLDKRSVRGGSWVSTAHRQAASSCYFYAYVDVADMSFGLRVLRVDGPSADFDHDADVDLVDFAFFQACFNGPNCAPAGAGCGGADLDRDGDVDLADFAVFQGCFNGPNRPIPVTTSQAPKLLAKDIAPYDEFGRTVSISGDYAVAGSHFDDDAGSNSGSACVFKRIGTTWVQQTKLTASDAASGDWFGHVVAIRKDRAVVGAPYDDDHGSNSGSAYVFRRSGDTWTQEAKLAAPDGAADDEFGFHVAIDGDRVIVGARRSDGAGDESGSAYVFRRDDVGWVQEAKLTASDPTPYARFGGAVSISGDYALVGAYSDDAGASAAGSAYVFRRLGASWVQEAKLTAPEPAPNDFFGWSVAIRGDQAVVGAPFDDDRGTESGSVYVFQRQGSAWARVATLVASDAAAWDFFGFAAAIDDEYVVVGAYAHDDAGVDSGSAYVFRRSGSAWAEVARLTRADAAAGDQFGQAVAISGTSAIVGAPLDPDAGPRAGSAYVYSIACPCAP